MIKIGTYFIVRMCAIISFLSITAIGFKYSGPLSAVQALFCSAAVLSMSPLSCESKILSKWAAICNAILLIGFCLILKEKQAAVISIEATIVLIYSLSRGIIKMIQLNNGYAINQIWKWVENYARLLQRLILLCIGITVIYLDLYVRGKWWTAVPSSLLIFLNIQLYYSSYTGHTGFLSGKTEMELRRRIGGNNCSCPPLTKEEGDRMKRLYERVLAYMEEKKPYLQPEFSLGDLAMAVFTNKTYLSRVINLYSGRNYRQFINHYRTMYAVELIKKDPKLSVSELTMMSGFSSAVTFNMAFRINMNVTPGSYRREYRP